MIDIFAIEYSTDKVVWTRLDDIQYTEEEADEFINGCPQNSGMFFRKTYLFRKER